MLKENKWKILVSSLVTVMPVLAGLVLWERLPGEIAIHFTFDGTPDNWVPKAVAVFLLPLILLGTHLLCIFVTANDPKEKNIGKRPISFLIWLCPVMSIVVNGTLYAYAADIEINIGMVCVMLIGLIEIVLGNVMPKVQQNYSFGIKTSWALDDPENWRHTHRFAGWCMVLGGLVLIATSFALNVWIVSIAAIIPALSPMVYSYVYYRRHKRNRE